MANTFTAMRGIVTRVEFVNDEVEAITSAAARAGQPLEDYIHDMALLAIGKIPWRIGPYCSRTGRRLSDEEIQAQIDKWKAAALA